MAATRSSADRIYYLDMLETIHARLRPRSYLEIGVRNGGSLRRSTTRSIGIDPAYNITEELRTEVSLERTTSDEFFARLDPVAWLGGRIEMAFIDGMHLFEFALRDFINVEKHCSWASVIVFDDIFPRSVDEAARERHTTSWTGDVFRIADVLREHRPDLTLLALDTDPTGLLVVTGLDPSSTVLEDAYDDIVARTVQADPQPVPDDVLRRRGALRPQTMTSSPLWGCLHRGQLPLHPRSRGVAEIQEAIGDPKGYRRRRRAASEAVRAGVRRVPLIGARA